MNYRVIVVILTLQQVLWSERTKRTMTRPETKGGKKRPRRKKNGVEIYNCPWSVRIKRHKGEIQPKFRGMYDTEVYGERQTVEEDQGLK